MARKNLLKGFKKPKGITFEHISTNPNYGKFTAYPFEPGFGTTVGNTLRRVLLSSIQGYAISSIRITSYDDNGIPHVISSEFEAIPHVSEDTLEIINSLKQIRLRLPEDSEQETIMKSLLQRDSNSQTIADRKLKDADIYNKFEQLAFKGQQPSHDEWEQMAQHLLLCYPGFKDFLSKHATLINDKEYKTCLLIRIGYKPTNIGAMLGVSSSYITELRTKMLLKLFGMSGSSKMFDKMLRDIY